MTHDVYSELVDAADTEWQQCMQAQEYEQWLKDEAAQREYQSWLDTINELNAKETKWADTQAIPVVVTSNPPPKERTSLVASN